MEKLLDRFLNYVTFDTQSKPDVRHVPSTEGQLKLACALQQELIISGYPERAWLCHGDTSL